MITAAAGTAWLFVSSSSNSLFFFFFTVSFSHTLFVVFGEEGGGEKGIRDEHVHSRVSDLLADDPVVS